MTKFVEGKWKSFVFKMIDVESDIPRVLEHMRNNFYRDEPLCKLAGYDEELANDFDTSVVGVIEDKLSFIALDENTDKVAGVLLISIVYKDPPTGHEKPCYKSAKVRNVIGVVDQCTEESKIFEQFPHIDKYGDYFMNSVDTEFRGLGLATEMYERSLKMLKAKGFTVVESVFTSPYTRKVAAKLQFKELHRIYFRDFVNSKGEKPFSHAGENEFAAVMALELKNIF